jgi:hypothetical protein
VNDAVQHMGMHAFHPDDVPATPADWLIPTYVICSYDSQINAVEPMLPFHFFSGDVNQFYEKKDIEYVEQSSAYLPTYYSAEFNAETKVVTVVLRGQSYTCKEEFDTAKAEFKAADTETENPLPNDDDDDDVSGAAAIVMPGLLGLSAVVSSLLF